MKGINYMEHLIRQLAEATRTMEIATIQIENLKGKIHDLEIENQRLRDQLAYKTTRYDELYAFSQSCVSTCEALEVDNQNLKARIARNVERIRRMEQGEL